MDPLGNLGTCIVIAVGLTHLSEQVVLFTNALRGTTGGGNPYGVVCNDAGLNRSTIPGEQSNAGMKALGCNGAIGDLDRPLCEDSATDLSRLIIRKEAIDHRSRTTNR